MSLTKKFGKYLAFVSLGLLPLTLPAAYIPVSGGVLYGDEPLPDEFGNDFLGYGIYVFDVGLGANPASGGFTTLEGIEHAKFRFGGGDVFLVDHSDPQATEDVFFEYRGVVAEDSFAAFGKQEEDNPDAVHIYNYGLFSFLRLEADAYPVFGETMRVYMEVSFEVYIDEEVPLAVAFHDELMTLTDGTGKMRLEAVATFMGLGVFTIDEAQLVAVPEPAVSAGAFGVGVFAFVLLRRRLRCR